MSVTSEVAAANYDLFYKHFLKSRNLLTTAVNADENSKHFICFPFGNQHFILALNTKRSVIALYNKAIRELKQALIINPDRCSSDRQRSMKDNRTVLETHLQLAEERVEALSKSIYLS